MGERYDVAVVGLGLFGSAALRHLAGQGARAVGIGPSEPETWEHHDGVFASHYDSGRITRQIDRRYEWADLAVRSITEYAPLAEATGIEFHRPVGTVWADADHERVREIERVAGTLELSCELAETTSPTTVHGWELPAGLAYAFEPDPAGYIDPRKLLSAQLAVAQQSGATVITDTVTARTSVSTGHQLHTAGGQVVEAVRVLLATGAYGNAYGLSHLRIPLRVKSEITTLARLGAVRPETYAELPTLIYGLEHPRLSYLYLVPPTEYPDGAVYLKGGADTTGDATLTTREEMNEWMRTGDSDSYRSDFDDVMCSLLPALPIEETRTKRCLITYTAHGLPYIDEVDTGLFVALGGNGRGAKSSDAIGRAAAALTLGRWDDPLPRDGFRVPDDGALEPEAVPL